MGVRDGSIEETVEDGAIEGASDESDDGVNEG